MCVIFVTAVSLIFSQAIVCNYFPNFSFIGCGTVRTCRETRGRQKEEYWTWRRVQPWVPGQWIWQRQQRRIQKRGHFWKDCINSFSSLVKRASITSFQFLLSSMVSAYATDSLRSSWSFRPYCRCKSGYPRLCVSQPFILQPMGVWNTYGFWCIFVHVRTEYNTLHELVYEHITAMQGVDIFNFWRKYDVERTNVIQSEQSWLAKTSFQIMWRES